MSLYADEDLTTFSSSNTSSSSLAGPSSSSSTSTGIDPITAFSDAVALPAESAAQADALVLAATRFEDVPDKLPVLLEQLLPMVVNGGDTLIRKWTLEMVLMVVGRSRLGGEVKVQVAQSSLTALLSLLNSPSPNTVKSSIHIFATIYPILFRLLATNIAPPGVLEAFYQSKARILALTLDPQATPQNVAGNVGVRAAGWKYVQRVMLAGTRAGSADPRLAKSSNNDPNISMLAYSSPLNAGDLENEATTLRNQLVTFMFSADQPAILHPIFNIIPLICKSRPGLAPALITSLTSWSPAQLEAKGRSGMQVRAVEKTLRLVMAHLLRHPPLAMFSVQLNDALQRQKSRLEVAWDTELRVRRAKRAAATQGMPTSMTASSSSQGVGAGSTGSNLGKHGLGEGEAKPDWYGGYAAYGGGVPAGAGPSAHPPTGQLGGSGAYGQQQQQQQQQHGGPDTKRQRIGGPAGLGSPGSGTGRGQVIDVQQLGLGLGTVMDFVMSGLRGLEPDAIPRAFDNARRNMEQNNADALPQLADMLDMPGQFGRAPPRQAGASGVYGSGRDAQHDVKEEEVLDPLEMDVDDDDLLADDDSDIDEAITFADFSLPPPEPLAAEDANEMLDDILARISATGQELAGSASATSGAAAGNDPWAWLTSAPAHSNADSKAKHEHGSGSADGGAQGGKDGLRGILDVKEMFMLLLSRLATRAGVAKGEGERKVHDGVKQENGNEHGGEVEVDVRRKGRERVAQFIAADFAARSKFAALWLNEEWYSERLSLGSCNIYTAQLLSILSAHLAKLDSSSSSSASARSLSLFLANVPDIPPALIDQLAGLAEDPDRAIVGFLALRDLVESRPPVRAKALGCLLDLCVHPDRKVRVLGISTVRRWVPGHRVSKEVVRFAERVLRRLGYAQEDKVEQKEEEKGEMAKEEEAGEAEAGANGGGVQMEATDGGAEGTTEASAPPPTSSVPTELADLSHFLPLPSPKSIQQHVELPFALSRRDPALLDAIFALYPTLPPFIQGQYEDLLVPLIQSLAVGPVVVPAQASAAAPPTAPKGPAAAREGGEAATNGEQDGASAKEEAAAPVAPAQPMSPHEKLMSLLREYPAAGTEKLVLRVISTLSKEGKSATIRDLVRAWVEQKGEDVDVRFVVPVLGELTRAEIEVQIPRIVMLLNTPDSRDIVRTAFATLIQKLTPADLLVALHNASTAIKPTIEAIGICFSMTTVFRSDVLVASMVRIADLPSGSIPIVFMRTIIQAVTTYKSLVPFVANTVLPKLVIKKIWTAGPQLWDGFVKLAKLIAPSSYGVLLQLPKEQIIEVLEKQPSLKPGLRTFLAAKPGARSVLVEVFGDQS